ncbi:MAG: hypothetical protein HYV97_00765 [Bdellovibrio sp.]|nr:hypothetical protein [Bdellovibrio sp.]
MMKKVICIIFFLAFELLAAEVKLDAKVDKALVSTGDIVMFTVTLDAPKELALEIPNVGDKIQGFRVVDFGFIPEKVVDGRKTVSQWYKLQADLVGSYILPALELQYKNSKGVDESIKSSEIFVEVESVLSKDKTAPKDIRDIKPIILSPPIWPYYLVVTVLVLLLIAVGIYFFKKLRKKNSKDAPTIPAHQIALDALINLPKKPLKLYAFTLSEIIRVYFEKTFLLPVTDRTIEEIRREIATVSLLSEMQRMKFMAILEKTDLIKFTDIIILDADCESLIQMTRQFVIDTMPQTIQKNVAEDSIV